MNKHISLLLVALCLLCCLASALASSPSASFDTAPSPSPTPFVDSQFMSMKAFSLADGNATIKIPSEFIKISSAASKDSYGMICSSDQSISKGIIIYYIDSEIKDSGQTSLINNSTTSNFNEQFTNVYDQLMDIYNKKGISFTKETCSAYGRLAVKYYFIGDPFNIYGNNDIKTNMLMIYNNGYVITVCYEKSGVSKEQADTEFFKIVEPIIGKQATASITQQPWVTPVPTTNQTTPNPTVFKNTAHYKRLSKGDKGQAVLNAKLKLYELGFFTSKPTTNSYKESTVEAVKKFEEAYGLKIDGILSTEDQYVLFNGKSQIDSATDTVQPQTLLQEYETLSIGSKGQNVLEAKKKLYQLGYFKNEQIQNDYDENMTEAVKAFEEANNLSVDGILSSEDQNILFNSTAKLNSPTGVVVNIIKNADYKAYDEGGIYFSVIDINWEPVDGATKYYVTCRNKKNNSSLKRVYVTTNSCSFSLSNLGSQKEIEVTVSVQALNDEKSIYSDFSKEIHIKIPETVNEIKHVLVFPNEAWASWYYRPYGLDICFTVKNTSHRKTVKSFKIYTCAVDSSGNFRNDDVYYYNYTNKTIKPGQKTKSDYISIPNCYEGDSVFAAIKEVYFTDGTSYTVDDSDLEFSNWTIN